MDSEGDDEVMPLYQPIFSYTGSADGTDSADGTRSADVSVWAADLKKRLKKTSPWPQEGRPQAPTIFWIPDDIRNDNRSAYKPQVVSIGPYHHVASPKLSLHAYKCYCVHYLLSLQRSEEEAHDMLARCLISLQSLSCRIGQCYSDGIAVKLTEEQLAELMLLDSSFIIRILFVNKRDDRRAGVFPDDKIQELLRKKWIRRILKYDLLKLENQIPFFVIEEMMTMLKIQDDPALVQPVFKYFSDLQPFVSTKKPADWDAQAGIFRLSRVFHLLHLFHSFIIFPISPSYVGKTTFVEGERAPNVEMVPNADVERAPNVEMVPNADVERAPNVEMVPNADVERASNAEMALKKRKFFHFLKKKKVEMVPNADVEKALNVERVPNATELQRAGVKFARKEDARSFLDVTFKGGVLEIPPINIEHHTISLFDNLIVFEQLCPSVKSHFTAYIVLMDCLIDTAHDVSIFRKNRIIHNKLSTDQAAADIFNSFTNKTDIDLTRSYLHQVFVDINSFRQIKYRRWFASLKREYLANPWMTLSVIAAIFLLGSTFLQAFFQIYAYYQPPKNTK